MPEKEEALSVRLTNTFQYFCELDKHTNGEISSNPYAKGKPDSNTRIIMKTLIRFVKENEDNATRRWTHNTGISTKFFALVSKTFSGYAKEAFSAVGSSRHGDIGIKVAEFEDLIAEAGNKYLTMGVNKGQAREIPK